MERMFLTVHEDKFKEDIDEINWDCDQMTTLFRYANSLGIYDMEDFIHKFIRCRFRTLLEERDPLVIYGNPRKIWKYFLLENEIKELANTYYDDNVIYWIGTTYAELFGATRIPLSKLLDVLPFKIMLRYYSIGNEMGLSTFIRRVNSDLKDYYDKGGTLPVTCD